MTLPLSACSGCQLTNCSTTTVLPNFYYTSFYRIVLEMPIFALFFIIIMIKNAFPVSDSSLETSSYDKRIYQPKLFQVLDFGWLLLHFLLSVPCYVLRHLSSMEVEENIAEPRAITISSYSRRVLMDEKKVWPVKLSRINFSVLFIQIHLYRDFLMYAFRSWLSTLNTPSLSLLFSKNAALRVF